MAASNATFTPLCANCQGPGNAACKGCFLVTYCSKTCQTADWKTHQNDCNSPLNKQNWQPKWAVERREPTFLVPNDGPVTTEHGTRKYLWGNMPSIDVLKLGDNEGETYEQDLKILFAASGDLRNVVKTIASLPSSHSKKPSITINDVDFDVVARNIIILLLALTVSEPQQAIESMIHCWYSALIRPADYRSLESLRPLIEDVCTKISGRAPHSLQAKTFTFGLCSLRIVLRKELWTALLAYLEVPSGMTAEKAHKIRMRVTMAPHRVDYLHREMIRQQPAHRVCKMKFRNDGILAPFSQTRSLFTIPNPTFFQTAEWPMLDTADPLSGWELAEVLQVSAGNAVNDLYGKLYVHIHSLLDAFKHRLTSVGATFELYNANARDLHQILAPNTFARIETSNICDRYCLGSIETVHFLGPLLQPPVDNPHATLVTLYMNAVADTSHGDASTALADLAYIKQYPEIRNIIARFHPLVSVTLLALAAPLGRDVKSIFTRFMKDDGFDELTQNSGMTMKKQHTVVEKWPTRLKLKPGQIGADAELDVALRVGSSYTERYVEWKRVD